MNNIPVVVSSTVAILSILLSFIKLFIENYAGSRRVKRLSDIVDISKRLERSNSRNIANDIIKIELRKIKNSLTRKLNKSNVALVIIISLFGSSISYLLVSWATTSSAVSSIIAWVLFIAVAAMTIGLAATGLSRAYEQEENKVKDTK